MEYTVMGDTLLLIYVVIGSLMGAVWPVWLFLIWAAAR